MKKYISILLLLASFAVKAQQTHSSPFRMTAGIGIQVLSTAPTDPFLGRIYLNSTAADLQIYDGTIWQAFASKGFAAATYEPKITAGTTAQYWRGDKTWQDLNTVIAANSTVAGKQAQLNGTGFIKASGTTITYDNSSYYLSSNPNGYINSYANIFNTDNGWNGYNRFFQSITVGSNVYAGGGATNNFAAGGYMWNNTNDAATATKSWALLGDASGNMNFWVAYGPAGSLAPFNRLTLNATTGVLNYNADVSASYGTESVTSKRYVDGKVLSTIHTETGYVVYLVATGNGSSTTITIPHGAPGFSGGGLILLTANSDKAANFKYATIDATNIYIYYSVAPPSGSQELLYTALIKPIMF